MYTVKSDYFEQTINSAADDYFKLIVGTDNNLNDIPPGVFTYTTTYYNNSNQSIFTESGQFDLTKVGKVKYPNPIGYGANANRTMILIGGIRNTVESQVQKINGYPQSPVGIDPSYTSSDFDMSIISYFNSKGYDTWYIAQPNKNGVRENAYDIGIAIEKIKVQRPLMNDINLICHSKGGLEIKALLGTTTNANNLTKALNGNGYNWANITQLGTSALTSDTILAVGGNQFTAGTTGVLNYLNIGALNNAGLQFISSSTVLGGFGLNATTGQATMFIGTSTPNMTMMTGFLQYLQGLGGFFSATSTNGQVNAIVIGSTSVATTSFASLANYQLYAQGTGGFVSSSTLGVNTLYIGTSTLNAQKLGQMQNVGLFVDGIARLAATTTNGTTIGSALVIDMATSSVATTSNALYALNGSLYYNGAQIAFGTSTAQQVVAGYMTGRMTTNFGGAPVGTDHVKFQTLDKQFTRGF